MATRRYLDARVIFCVLAPAPYAPVVVELVIILGRYNTFLEEGVLGRQTSEVLQHGVADIDEAHGMIGGLSWEVYLMSVDGRRGIGWGKEVAPDVPLVSEMMALET
jgi:hypothetical protein